MKNEMFFFAVFAVFASAPRTACSADENISYVLYQACDKLKEGMPQDSNKILRKVVLNANELPKDLRDTTFIEVTIAEPTLLAGKDLKNSRWVDSSLHGADLTGSTFNDSMFCNTDLSDSKISSATFERVQMLDSSLENVQAQGSKFTNAKIAESSLHNANFSKAVLDNMEYYCSLDLVSEKPCGPSVVHFDGASLKKAHIFGLLEGAPYDGTEPSSVGSFKNANIDGSYLEPMVLASIDGAVFDSISLVGPSAPELFSAREVIVLRANNPWIPVGGNKNTEVLSPSFSCAAAASAIENTICTNGELAVKDVIFSTLYSDLLKNVDKVESAKIQDDQRVWISKSRNSCTNKSGDEINSCLAERYEERLDELFSTAQRLKIAPKPREGTYRPLSTLFWKAPPETNSELVSKMRRFFSQRDEGDYLTVAFDEKRVLQIEGSSIGANGHVCSIEGSLAALSKGKPGAYVSVEDEGLTKESNEFDLLTVRFVPPYLLTSGGRFYCGMRAGWFDVYQLDEKKRD